MVSKDWYAPREIHFTHRQVIWLIQNLGSLRAGYWPPEASNYIDITGQKSGKHKAYFVTPVEYATEIAMRLERAGTDGLILLATECWGESDESMASYFRKPVWSIRKRRKTALGYVASGPTVRWHNTPKRKGETYQEFKARKKRWLH